MQLPQCVFVGVCDIECKVKHYRSFSCGLITSILLHSPCFFQLFTVVSIQVPQENNAMCLQINPFKLPYSTALFQKEGIYFYSTHGYV